MDSTYLAEMRKLSKRLHNLKREKDVYEYALDNVGKKIVKAQLMSRFGYYVGYASNTDNYSRTRLQKYTEEVRRQVPTKRGRWVTRIDRTVRDLIWLPTEVADDHAIRTIASRHPRWGYKLCFKETIPFWLLKEYGGPYSGREFIDELQERIDDTNKKIKENVTILKKQMKGECPCKNCVCVPTCKFRSYTMLATNCALVDDYLFKSYPRTISSDPKNVLFLARLQMVVDNVKPRSWDVNTIAIEKGGSYGP